MIWRPWIVAGLLLVAVLVNAALVAFERVPSPDAAEVVTRVDEPLRHLLYTPTNRRNNFKAMGMDDELAHVVATRIDRHAASEARLLELLERHSADVGEAFCPGSGLPQPWAALRFLVRDDGGRREVVDAGRLYAFEPQPWFATAPIDMLYRELEAVPDRRGDATLMGVAAALLGREVDALEGRSPWSRGLVGTWGFRRLTRDAPQVEKMVVDYFSWVHYLTELANRPDGICG